MSSEDLAPTPRRKRRLKHGPEHMDLCPVCMSEFREEIECLYVALEDPKEIAVWAEIDDPKDITRHCEGFELDLKRADNTEGIVRRGINKAIDNGVFDKLDADQAFRLVQHRDKQTGKVREGSRDQRPQILILQGIPFVPPNAISEDDAEAIVGKVLPMLPASDDDEDANVPVLIPKEEP